MAANMEIIKKTRVMILKNAKKKYFFIIILHALLMNGLTYISQVLLL